MPSAPLTGRLFPIALAVLSLSFSCGKEKLIETACREDSQCPDGNICDEFRCLPAAAKACSVVTDGNPILQADPYSVSFGAIDVPQANQPITLHNIGNCTLTLFEAKLAKGTASPFLCEFCNGNFPIEIFPGRSTQLVIDFQQKAVGAVTDELNILSDDKEFPEMRIPLSANYLGQPKLVVTPNPIDFGYVAQGRQGTVALQISNQGTGVAPITVEAVDLSVPTTMDFSLVQPFTGPVTLNPIGAESHDIIPLELRYTPRTTAKHNIELWVHTSNGGLVTVPVTGDAETPPKVTYAPMMINLGDVPLGRTNLKPVTLTNTAGAPLNVSWTWGGATPNTDLFTTPTTTAPIVGGMYAEIQVGFTATALGPATGLLNFTTNDPSRTSFSIPVTANGVMGAGPEVVKIDMTFDNGSDGTFDNDVRNVDMTLEHPFGYVCNKQNPNPMNWGSYGKPSWLSFAPKEEPERIVLADSMTDGTYRVQLAYMESCKSIPTGLLAGLLGISTSVLLGYFSGGAIPLDPTQVSMLIEQVCLSHGSTTATVTVYVNGVVKKEKTVTLGAKGQTVYALDLIRTNGMFDAQ